MKSLSRPVAVLALVVVTLAGCGGNDSDGTRSSGGGDDTATTSSARPADGDTVTADGFSYVVPKGWKAAKQSTILSLAADQKTTQGFRTSINVVSDNTIVGVHGKDLEDAVEKVLATINAKDVEIKERVTIDGEEAVHSAAVMNLNGNQYRVEQYGVEHDGKGYFVTFSFSLDIDQAKRQKICDSILTTWKWDS